MKTHFIRDGRSITPCKLTSRYMPVETFMLVQSPPVNSAVHVLPLLSSHLVLVHPSPQASGSRDRGNDDWFRLFCWHDSWAQVLRLMPFNATGSAKSSAVYESYLPKCHSRMIG